MAITRTRLAFEKHFVQIPNHWMRDKRLSRRSRGLLAEIMTHEAGWVLTIEQLTDNGPEGRDAVRKAIIELEQVGYLERKRQKDKQGKFGGTDYILRDPWEQEDNGPMTENPTLENNDPEQPMTENPTVDNPTLEKSQLRTPSKAFKENHVKEDGGETQVGNSPAREEREATPWEEITGRAVTAPVDGATHPDRCAFHQGIDFPPPCQGCKQARQQHMADLRAANHRMVLAEQEARREAVRARRAAAADCRICDEDGYDGLKLCDHDPERPARVKQGVELLRNSLNQK